MKGAIFFPAALPPIVINFAKLVYDNILDVKIRTKTKFLKMFSSGETAVTRMKTPTPFIKIRSANKRYRRAFYIDNSLSTLGYNGSTKIQCCRRMCNDPQDMSKGKNYINEFIKSLLHRQLSVYTWL